WEVLSESKANPPLKPQAIRLPLETEWATAAGGEEPAGRYAWDEVGKQTTSLKEIVRRANTNESGMGRTTPVNAYPLGKSPHGVMDMAGNVWEGQANYSGHDFSGEKTLGLRGGSWNLDANYAGVSFRDFSLLLLRLNLIGFRVVVSLPSG
ncbi:MAG: formylglycine-generating enzyme family protein, partial [Anaerolineales bacterium]